MGFNLYFKKFDEIKMKIDTNNLCINHANFVTNDGLCVGISFFWLLCLIKEKNPHFLFDIVRYWKCNNKNSFININNMSREKFKEYCKYINVGNIYKHSDISDLDPSDENYLERIDDYFNKIKDYSNKTSIMRDTLNELQYIGNNILKSNSIGIFLTDKTSALSPCVKHFFSELFSVVEKRNEAFVFLGTSEHFMAMYAKKNTLNGLLDPFYEVLFFDPNDSMGESIPIPFHTNKHKSNSFYLNKFFDLIGKRLDSENNRYNFLNYANKKNYIFFSILELNDFNIFLKKVRDDKLNKFQFNYDYEGISELKITGMSSDIYEKKDKANKLLWFCSRFGNISHVYLLLKIYKNILDINYIECDTTSLYIASENGHKEIVDLLLKNGANPNIYSIKFPDVSPLHVASKNGHKEIVDLLLKNGANPNAKFNGLSPIDFASQKGYKEIVVLLQKHGSVAKN